MCKKHIFLHIELKRKPHICPKYGEKTDKIKDYRIQHIKDIPAFGMNCVLVLRKRRYICTCGKSFQKENNFLPKYYRMTRRLSAFIIYSLANDSKPE